MSRSPRSVCAGLLAVALAFAGGCSSGTVADGAVADTSTSTSTSSSSSTTTTEAPRCPSESPAAGTWADGPVALDADGDGQDDEAELFIAGEQALALEVRYAAGGRSVAFLSDDSVFTGAGVRIERVVDFEGDGDHDVWLVVGAGASTEVLSLIVSDGCNLARPRTDEAANAFPVGASVGFLSGVECTDVDGNGGWDGFLAHSGQLVDGTTYEGTTTWWGPAPDADAGSALLALQTTPFTVDLGAEDGSRYSAFTCT